MALDLTTLRRVQVVYDADDGKSYSIGIRQEYLNKTGLTEGAGADGTAPKGFRPRHVWAAVHDGQVLVRRQIPCSKAFANSVVLRSTTINADNVQLVVTGYIGEKRSGRI